MENLSELIKQFNQELSRIIEERKTTTSNNQGDENFWQYTELCQLLKQILETFTDKGNPNPGIILYLVHMLIPIMIKIGTKLEFDGEIIIQRNGEDSLRIDGGQEYLDISCNSVEPKTRLNQTENFFVDLVQDNTTIEVESLIPYMLGTSQFQQNSKFKVKYDKNGLVRKVKIEKLLIILDSNNDLVIIELSFTGTMYLSLTYTIEGKNIAVTSKLKQNSTVVESKEHICVKKYESEPTELSSPIYIMLPIIPGQSRFDTQEFISLIGDELTFFAKKYGYKFCYIENRCPDSQIEPNEAFVNLIWQVFPGIATIASDKFKKQNTRINTIQI